MMNNLTNDMTRLCSEIAALHDARAALLSSFVEAKEALRDTVSALLGGFRDARGDMAAQTKVQLQEFVGCVKGAVTDLQQKVAGLQGEFRDDLAGAHRAWHGVAPAAHKAPTAAEPPLGAGGAAAEPSAKAKNRKR
jgi:hypothetical protein